MTPQSQPRQGEPAPRLWVCHECELIESNAEAERHVEDAGHRVVQLDQETSDAVRAEQHAQRTSYLASLMMVGRMNRDAS